MPICCFFISRPASLGFCKRAAFHGHLKDLDLCLKTLPETDQGRKWFDIRSTAESGAFPPTHSWGCTSAVWKAAKGAVDWTTRHQRGQNVCLRCSSYSSTICACISLNIGFALLRCKLYTHVIFQKYFILILTQVQGNKRARIYLTGHGNETVKVLFCWSTLFLDKDMQVNTGGVYRNQSRTYHTVEMPFGLGCHLTPSRCTDFTQQRSLFLSFNHLL